METILDAFGTATSRRGRAPRAAAAVRRTHWHDVAMIAVVVQLVLLGVALFGLAWATWTFTTDDLFFALGTILLPFAITGLGMGIGAAAWLVGLVRRLALPDTSVRVDLAAVGAIPLLVAVPLATLGPWTIVLAVALPSVSALAAAIAPSAWVSERPAG